MKQDSELVESAERYVLEHSSMGHSTDSDLEEAFMAGCRWGEDRAYRDHSENAEEKSELLGRNT